jgi:hypothetical protein
VAPAADFLATAEAELHLFGVPFDAAVLRQWPADCGPLVEDDPDAGRWARAFLEARAGVGAG